MSARPQDINLTQQGQRRLSRHYIVFFALIGVILILVIDARYHFLPESISENVWILVKIGIVVQALTGFMAIFAIGNDFDTSHSDPDVQALLRKEISLTQYAERKGIGSKQ